MADQDFLDALNDCIDRLATGQSVEDCARNYPEYAAELRPRLETRALIRRAQPNPLELTQARDRVRFRLESHRRQRRPSLGLARVVGGLLMALILIVAATGVVAENSLPGDALYGAKRITENVRAAFASSPAEAHQQQTARRIAEITRLLALKRAADVDCEGEVQAISGIDWRVAGLALQVMPDIPGAGKVQVGDTIEVQAATTTHGDLVAKALTVIHSQTSTVVPSLTPTSASTASNPGTRTPTLTSAPPILGVTLPASAIPSQVTAAPNAPAPRSTATPRPASDDKGHDGGSNSGSSGGSGSDSGSGSNSGSSGGSGSGSSGDSGSNSGSSGGSGSH